MANQKAENEKLIIFGWIVTILGVPLNADPARYNKLTDKLYELMQFRHTEALGGALNLERAAVAIAGESPPQLPSVAHGALDRILPCIDSTCDGYGTCMDGSTEEPEPAQCQYCYEVRLPIIDLIIGR